MEENKENTQKKPIVSAYGAVLGETASPKEETKEAKETKTDSGENKTKKPTYGLYTHTSPVDNDPFADSPFTNPVYAGQNQTQNRMTREQYADHMKKQRKHSRILRQLITFVIVLAVLFVVVPIAINQIEKLTCDRPLKKMESMVNNRQTSSLSVIKAMMPYFVNTAYEDIYEICNNNVECRSDLQSQESNFQEMMETLYSSMFTSEKDSFSYTINRKTELSKEELQSIQKTYGNVAGLIPSIKILAKAVYGKTALSETEINQITDKIDKMGTTMEKMKVFAGYKLNITSKVNDKEQNSLNIVVVLANGRWMIDYISSLALSADENYNIEQMYQSVDVQNMQNTLNALATQISATDKTMDEILDEILQSTTSQYSFQ